MTEPDVPGELEGEAGWTPLDRFNAGGEARSFVRAGPTTDGLRVRYFQRDRDGALVGRIGFGPGTQGPPGHAHGGSMAAVLDDAMGVAAWIAGHAVVAAEIKVKFKSMLPLGTVATLEAWVASAEGKRVETRGHLLRADGKPFATAEGIFIHIGLDRFGDLIEQANARRGGGA